jgi:hypothetical protein
MANAYMELSNVQFPWGKPHSPGGTPHFDVATFPDILIVFVKLLFPKDNGLWGVPRGYGGYGMTPRKIDEALKLIRDW